METEIEKLQPEKEAELIISSEIRQYLTTTSKWATFLAIIAFIGTGLLMSAGVMMSLLGGVLSKIGESASSTSPAISMLLPYLGVIYIIFAAVYLIPALYLYHFASKSKKALASNIQHELNESFRNLKRLFKFYGIMIIVLISAYIILIPSVVIMAMSKTL